MTGASLCARLTVLLITYNQAEYVCKSVESILRQRLDEAFDIVVADDGSTDDTVAILQRYAGENPHVRFTFLDYSTHLGITRNYQRAFAACRSEYVAVMEGDDAWASPYKLAKQRDFLDAHWECDLCAVNYFVLDEFACRITPRVPASSGYALYGARELIAGTAAANFSTCMYRRAALANLPSGVFELHSYDWIVNICVGRSSLIGFLYEPLSVYRMHGGGAWSRLSDMEKLKSQLALIPGYDALTDGVFHAEFLALAKRLQEAIAHSQIAQLAAPVAEPLIGSLPWLMDLIPPLAVTVARLVLPPAALRYLVGRGFRGGA
ncbi:MAG: glycosyltransferase [Armatimonadota bacterium]